MLRATSEIHSESSHSKMEFYFVHFTTRHTRHFDFFIHPTALFNALTNVTRLTKSLPSILLLLISMVLRSLLHGKSQIQYTQGHIRSFLELIIRHPPLLPYLQLLNHWVITTTTSSKKIHPITIPGPEVLIVFSSLPSRLRSCTRVFPHRPSVLYRRSGPSIFHFITITNFSWFIKRQYWKKEGFFPNILWYYWARSLTDKMDEILRGPGLVANQLINIQLAFNVRG